MRQFQTVKKGSAGVDVYILQALFRALEYTGKDGKAIDIDGYCGDNTVFAINKFQESSRAYGVECGSNGKNDSTFGPKCWSRILGV